ncbi:MAG: redoxin domain-containing protein [Candidatus Sedimenticola sp. (ex Thyasira tokunagai)]
MAVKPDDGECLVVAETAFRKTIFLLILLVMMSLLSACSENTPQMGKGNPVPSFVLPDIEGNKIHYPERYQQQVVVISFWADWCPSCKNEMRDFENLFKQYGEKGLRVMAINIKQEREVAVDFIKDLDLSYDILLDKSGEIAKAYSVSSLPSAFIINRKGELHTRIIGEVSAEVLEDIVTSLL